MVTGGETMTVTVVTEAMVVHNIARLMELGTTWATMTMAIAGMVSQEMSTEKTLISRLIF